MKKTLLILLFLGLTFMFSNVKVYGQNIVAGNPLIEDGKVTIDYEILVKTRESPNDIIWGRMAIQFKDGLYDGADNECATITIAGAVEEPYFLGMLQNDWHMKLIIKSPDEFSVKTKETLSIDGSHPNRTMTFGDRTFETGFFKETYKMKDLLDSDAEGIGIVELYYVLGQMAHNLKIQDFKFQYKNGKVKFSKTFEVVQVPSAPSVTSPSQTSPPPIPEPATPSCSQGYGRGIGDFKCWTVCKSSRIEDFMAIGTFSCKNVELHFMAWNKIDMNWDGQNYHITYDNGWILLGIWGERLPNDISGLITFCVENSRYREDYYRNLRHPQPPYGKWPK
ncbi:MAG: hypothetical protein Q8N42_01000 [bacterium]|nr:hypothetical protein [bacterium]